MSNLPGGASRCPAWRLPAAATRVRLRAFTRPRRRFLPLQPILIVLLATLVAVALAIVVGRRFGARHHRAVGDVLDAADALEARLRAARAEIEAVAGEDQADPVRAAMREMLRQRLWLQEHGSDASVAELRSVRDSIDAARQRIEHQLARIERARAPQA